MESLAPGGRCAVVVPEGALFGSTTAHKELRRKLLDEFEVQAVISLPAGVFKPYAGVKTSVLVFRRPANSPTRDGDGATRRVWFYEIANDGYDPSKIQGGGRPETPERNEIPRMLAAWEEYRASGFRDAPGAEGGGILDAGSDLPRSWWVPLSLFEDSDFNLTAARYKPRVAEDVCDEDPAELIRGVLVVERRSLTGSKRF